jgi:hypothetical protein
MENSAVWYVSEQRTDHSESVDVCEGAKKGETKDERLTPVLF